MKEGFFMIELVGIQDVNFTDKEGRSIVGTKLYYLMDVDPDTKARGFLGMKADSHFFPVGSQMPSAISCGKHYDFIFAYTGGRYPRIVGIREVVEK